MWPAREGRTIADVARELGIGTETFGFLGDVTGQMIDMPSELPRLLER